MYAKFRYFLNYYANFAGYTTAVCFFPLFLKINYLAENLIGKYMTVLRFLISRRSFDKSCEIVNHVEPQRYRELFFAILQSLISLR